LVLAGLLLVQCILTLTIIINDFLQSFTGISSMGEAVGAELYLTETNLVSFALNYSRPSNEIVWQLSAVLQVLPCLAIIR
jgi:hypothetical protein